MLREHGYGRIINIRSAALKHATATVGYTAAKHGAVGRRKQLAQVRARHGITVNCLGPGWTNTDLVLFEDIGKRSGASEAEACARAEAESVQNCVLEPGELGPMSVKLAWHGGAAITGQVFGMDGG